MKFDAHRAWPASSKEVVVTDRAPKSRRLAYHNECVRVKMELGLTANKEAWRDAGLLPFSLNRNKGRQEG
jgi:hypothetical protein